jgi:hypothetical protein
MAHAQRQADQAVHAGPVLAGQAHEFQIGHRLVQAEAGEDRAPAATESPLHDQPGEGLERGIDLFQRHFVAGRRRDLRLLLQE